MNRRLIRILIMILIIIIGLFFILRKPEEYSDDPKTWIEREGIGLKHINVDRVTRGTGWDEDDQIYAIFDGIRTVFPYEGFYKGDYFEKQFIENRTIKIKISSTFKKNDEVIEGYIIERLINDTFEVFIFVDEDWKKSMPLTNIMWGADYSKAKPFEFNEISDGVYMDKIIDDPVRFELNYSVSNTGIIVGNITQYKVQNGILDKDVTVIIFQ